MTDSTRSDARNRALTVLFGTLAAMWLLEIVDWLLLAGGLDVFGILPRTTIGLRNIVFAPFLHVGFEHVAANSAPFLILGGLVIWRNVATFLKVTGVIVLIGGLGTWLIGAPGFHLGASMLIFGYFGYLLLRGYFERSWQSILLSVVILVVYGGLLWGVLPGQPGVSWEGHLSGFVGGGAAARFLAQRPAWGRRPSTEGRSVNGQPVGAGESSLEESIRILD